MTKNDLIEWLQQVGDDDCSLDEHSSRCIVTTSGLEYFVEYLEQEEKLLIYSPVAQVSSAKEGATLLLREALKLNFILAGQYSLVLTLDERTDHLVLLLVVPSGPMLEEDFYAALALVIDRTEWLSSFLQDNQSGASDASSRQESAVGSANLMRV
ncbi:hypothetical protein BTA51_04800 [Hahella sp. CCB-MM4]|uniref:type III secretion system chaperone n=1 Tax=Hahella sp. (strain CCB-MM4) TaxID=1926491 RepID=UPI000B9BFCAA|nr:type III secretion system chaperone [Hahella sp. CCB-MM4]OZG74334.1 hypothetical protein BTA51_04800 [Hahella sp. CCB-MM4]